jgi:RNA polymerase sigma factor (sigma-70 family)
MIESAIIKSAMKQDRTAYKTIYETCSPYVYSIIKRYIIDANDYKDILQETFARVFLSLKSFDETKGDFKYWLRKIVINQCMQHLRKYKKLSLVVPLSETHETFENVGDVLNGLTKTDIENLFAKMPLGYSRVFMMMAIDDYTHKEIAEILDISEETSRSQYHRAKNWIKNNVLNNKSNLLINGL